MRQLLFSLIIIKLSEEVMVSAVISHKITKYFDKRK
nr:MAG TPA: hypothetical protein [Caudoviricetes sp.]